MERILSISEHRNTPGSSRGLLDDFHPLVGEFSTLCVEQIRGPATVFTVIDVVPHVTAREMHQRD
jgi:hypothetical protein